MKFVVLAVLCVLFPAGWTIAWIASGHHEMVLRAASLTHHLVVLSATVSTASLFRPRDRLRWAWLCFSILAGLNVINNALRPDTVVEAMPSDPLTIVHTIIVNAMGVIPPLLLTRAWAASGMVPPWRWRAMGGGLVLALAAAGPTLWMHFPKALDGDGESLVMVISSLGDIGALALLGPLVASALWMRGGAMMWPYAFLTMESLVWLAYDFAGHSKAPWTDYVFKLSPAYAWYWVAAAAIAHRWIVQGVDEPE